MQNKIHQLEVKCLEYIKYIHQKQIPLLHPDWQTKNDYPDIYDQTAVVEVACLKKEIEICEAVMDINAKRIEVSIRSALEIKEEIAPDFTTKTTINVVVGGLHLPSEVKSISKMMAQNIKNKYPLRIMRNLQCEIIRKNLGITNVIIYFE